MSSDTTGTIPFIIMKDEKQYVFDHFTEDSDDLFGELNGNVVITAVYLLDSDNDGTPDQYEATVTYKVENGTWSDGTATDKTENFILKTFDEQNNTWKPTNPTLGSTIPEGMKPDSTHVLPGAWKDETPVATTPVTGSKTYTYTFDTEAAPKLKIDKAVTKVNNVEVATGETVVVQRDDVLTYTITVQNIGNQVLNNVIVTDSMWQTDKVTGAVIGNGAQEVTVSSGDYTIGTLNVGDTVTITYTYTVTDADVTAGKVTNNVSVTSDKTPGGESGGTETAVIGDIIVTPADITIYTGGDGYTGTVVGTEDPKDSGMPEPGFYVTLPKALDDALKNVAGHTGTDPLDLTGHLTLTAKATDGSTRTWSLVHYAEEGTSTVTIDGVTRYIYRIEAGENQDPVRVQFKDGDKTVVSDDFDIDMDALYDEFEMSIYGGKVDGATVEAVITFGTGDSEKTVSYTAATGTGKLIVRGVVNEGDTTTEIVATPPTAGDKIVAAADANTKYVINGSGLEVNDPTKVQLLVDSIVDEGKTELKDYVLDNLNSLESLEDLRGVVDSSSKFAFQYLDLVDTSNGNVWIRPAGGDMTIFWPYPADADTTGNFYVIHFDGLDRNYTNLETALQGNPPELLTATQVEGGITFTTSSFSPFAVVYDAKVTEYTIDASAGANGSIDPVGSVTVAAGADKTFTITADAGYHISDVTVDGKSVGAVSSYTFEDVMTNHTIRATFAKNSNPTSYTLYYHSNFGEDVTFYQSSSTRSVTVKEYDDVGRLPERDGYVFVSWNTEPDGSGTRYMPGDAFRIDGSSDDLYAQWQKDKTGPDDSGVSNWLETDEHNAYLSGYPDSTFRADRNMTRAEVAQMFYALLLDKNVTITKSFSDVPDDAWYATAVKTLASLGMMDGYPDGTFRPDEPITRAEFATVGLAFAYDPLDASCSYYDVGANAWYYTYVAQATTYGWIGGYLDNTFRPGNNITRVEVCVIVNNMLGRDADERYIDRNEDELVHFVDLSDSYWGYYTIMESTNTHEYTGSFTNEKWTDVK